MALATASIAAAGSSSAFAAVHHSRAASPPIHARKAVTGLYVSGYAPAQFPQAYALDRLACSSHAAHPCGSGQTVGIIDAYDDPTVEADLQTFDAEFGLAACTIATGCLTVATPRALPPADPTWAGEVSLDVQWVHAIAPGALILLVESIDRYSDNLLAAVDYAVNHGASVVSMSWGGAETSDETADDSHFRASGVSFVAASGDKGSGTQYPAASPYVIGVGGTSLPLDASGALTGPETAWGGRGGGGGREETPTGVPAELRDPRALRHHPHGRPAGHPT